MHRQALEQLTREALIELAEKHGVSRPQVLTQLELIDELATRTAESEPERARARGWLGRARDLIAKVVDKGLHLPQTARAIAPLTAGVGGVGSSSVPAPPPVPTVTLAEIYAAQGHLEKAIATLDEILEREPEHAKAAELRERFSADARTARAQSAQRKSAEAEVLGAAEPRESGGGEGALSITTPTAEESALGGALVQAASEAEADAIGEADLSSETLPERYEVDEVVALGVDPHTVYLYWEVRPTTLAQAQAEHPEGKLAVRVAAVSPAWSGPRTQTRDHVVDALYGDLSVRGLEPGAIVRVSVGWLAGTHFQPLAIGDEVTTPRKLSLETGETSDATPATAGGTEPSVDVDLTTGAAAKRSLAPALAAESARARSSTTDATAAPVPAVQAVRAPVERLGLAARKEERELLRLTEHVDEIASGVITTLRLRLRRVMQVGSSELAWEELSDEQRLQLRARRRWVEFDRVTQPGESEGAGQGAAEDLGPLRAFPWLGRRLRGGSSEWSLGGASELSRRGRSSSALGAR